MDAIEPSGLAEASDGLAQALSRGDRQAVRAVYREYHEQVRAFACRLLGSAADAEEVVQEVFLALPGAMHRYRGESRLSTFVMGVAVNHARHSLRASVRRRAATKRFVEAEGRELLSSSPEMPDESLAREQLAAQLIFAMDQLGEDQRVAFVLCEVEERTSLEAAEILGVPSSTVRSRVGLAREKLQRVLAAEVHR
jgi:RNA polymerase sigma-70 factor (ECF subfamily)